MAPLKLASIGGDLCVYFFQSRLNDSFNISVTNESNDNYDLGDRVFSTHSAHFNLKIVAHRA